jgi:hypothetical protein
MENYANPTRFNGVMKKSFYTKNKQVIILELQNITKHLDVALIFFLYYYFNLLYE